ncbi:Ig-like domain-containing protein [Methanobrevibacter millerae]|nr:Ig-like domain-containing protein [Methanobrevibacter millerae]
MDKFKIVLICLILCLFLSLSSVAAADSDLNTTDKNLLSLNDVSANPLSSTNDDMVSVNENSESFTALKNLVTNGGDITLDKNYTYSSSDSLSNGIIITKDVTITGNGNVIIDANSKARIFNIQGATVTLRGINFTNGVSNYGGAILTDSSSTLIVDGCSFEDNSATQGGAIRIGSTNSIIKNSTFYRNYASFTGNGYGGGAIEVYTTATNTLITNCSFEENHAAAHGGAIEIKDNQKNVIIRDSYFGKNYAYGSGGSIFVEQSRYVDIINNTFEENYVTTNNPTNAYGGAIHFNNWVKNINIINSSFLSNNAGRGGAIRMDGSENGFEYFYLYNLTFENNYAVYEGGGFSSNQASRYFYFENCSFINCTTGKSNANGGGMYLNSRYSQFKNITFINCSSQNGGSLDIKYDVGSTLSQITIINSSAQNGGAVRVFDTSSILSNVEIINSTATGLGGAIYWTGSYGTMYNINITNSTSNNNGGAIYWSSNNAYTIENISVINSRATNGGGLYLNSQGNTIININLINCTATNNGGALYINSDTQHITNGILNDNKATKYGGAIYVGNNNYIYFNDLTINASNAYNGGGLYYAGCIGSALWVTNCTFTNNNASHNGGGIYYVVVDGLGDNPVVCRDYNDFDGKGVLKNGRTSVSPQGSDGSTYANHINSSYFKNNNDYSLNVSSLADSNAIMGVVNISSPKDPNRNSYMVVINVTHEGVPVSQMILNTTAGYDTYFNRIYEKFIINIRENLTRNTKYDVSVGFEDSNYLYKEATTTFTTLDIWNMGDFKYLQSLIDDVPDGGVLDLSRSFEFISKEDYGNKVTYPDDYCMNITKSIIINGNGYSINALGYSRIFNITANNVILNDIVFINGNSSGKYRDSLDKGGAIFWAGQNGIINNSAIVYNYAGSYGGGIYYNSSASDCTIDECLFSNNKAIKNGGAIDCNATKMRLYNTTFESNVAENGAALCREASATGGSGRNNTFRLNHADIAGAALAWIKAEKIYIDTYTFIDNTADFSGGAIYVGVGSANCTIFNSTFIGNNVTNFTGGHGGAIEWYAVDGNILNSTFINNNAYTGGALYVGSDSGNINITNSGFLRNNAITIGGAIDLTASSVAVNNTYFRENTASEGGAIFVGGTGENNFINSSYFTNNIATYGKGGAINWNASAGQIFNTNFTQNSAEYGGAVYIGGNSDNSQITNVTFTGNNATYNGGAIDWNATGGKLYNTTFISNYAGEYGAALCRESGATGGSGRNNTFRLNHADIAGAALAWMNVTGIHINYYYFYDNTANSSGGAIYIGNGSDNCIIDNSIFEGNNVTNLTGGHGGAVDVVADNASVINSNFTNNNAFYGGALFVGSGSGNTNITNSIFTKNNAIFDGGAINLQASAVTLNNTHFYTNTALRNGGALYVGGEGTTNKIYDSKFEENNAGNNGGAIFWRAYAGHIAYSNFTSNFANYGGAIYLNGVSSNTNITHVIFKSNNATKNGGAIDCNSTRMNLTYTLFESNYAGEYGAALCRESGATNGFGFYNNFTSNHAGIAGAALAWMDVKNININHYIFTNNIADQMGGAIYATKGSDNFIINNCDFKGNNVTNSVYGQGGAIDSDSTGNTIINSNFTNNNAFDGGAIHIGSDSGHTNITNVTFNRNGAYHDGGAINLVASGVRLNDTRFYSNTALRNGGAVYVGGQGSTNVILDSLFDKNDAGNRGGAIDWLAQKGNITYSNFTRNSAHDGGALYLNGESSESVLSHLIFSNNTATGNGGAIDCNATLVNLTHTQFTSNRADYGAALARESGATGGFGINNTFIRNHAYVSGAALAWLGVSNIHINNYTFINNTADYSGAAIYVGSQSDNCIVDNSTFIDNYVSNAISGRGGAIDWIGNNGTIINTNFTRCISVNAGAVYVAEGSDNMTINNTAFTSCNSLTNGGALVLCGDNVTISYSNFISSVAMVDGGAIAGFNSDNANISYCFFKYNVAAGYIDVDGTVYGEGGAIYWENSTNLRLSNSKFRHNEAHLSGGSISADNCNDSVVFNITTYDETAFRNGGSIAWINSNNVNITDSYFYDSGANYCGGTVYLSNVYDINVKDSKINSTYSSWDYGGGMYVDGNVTIENVTFNNTHSDKTYGTALYFHSGNSTVINCTFENAKNTILINKTAEVHLTKNKITSNKPTKNIMYLTDIDDEIVSDVVNYAIWNDGNLYLDKNNFDYVIYNNGTIWTKTTTKMLNNESYNVTWNDYFIFFANITDDNLNTIISVHSLNTTNNVYQDVGNHYILPYNADTIQCIYQGNFHLIPIDKGLKMNTVYNGTLNVKMPVTVSIDQIDITLDGILVNATLKPVAGSNYTIKGQNVTFLVYDGDGNLVKNITVDITDIDEHNIVNTEFTAWSVANATLPMMNLGAGVYTIGASYSGDTYHMGSIAINTTTIHLRQSWIIVNIENITYGENIIALITTNSNGTVHFNLHGRKEVRDVEMTKGPDGNYTGRLEITVDEYLTTGDHDVGVVLEENAYYAYATNLTSFTIYKLNTTVNATPIKLIIDVGEKQTIIVIVNDTYAKKNATGFVNITVGGKTYYDKLNPKGEAQFDVFDLHKGQYQDIEVNYDGDAYFNSNSAKVSFAVGQISDYNITVKVNDVKLGENATIYISLPTEVTKNLTVYVNNTKYENVIVNNGLAILTVNTAILNNPGQYIVNVTYPGDDVYALKYNNGTKFNVTATDDWNLYLSVEAHTYGQNTIFTLTVPSNVETKKVNLTIDGLYYQVTIDANGEGSLTLNNLSGGLHTVIANYTGDSRYLTKTNSTKFLINQAASTVTLSQNANGDVIATVLPTNVTGTVTFYVNERNYTVVLTGNTALLNKDLTVRNNSIVVIYNGDINFTSSKNSTKFSTAKNTASVNVTAIDVVYGNVSEITVKVPNVQKGYVTITVNDTLVNVTVKIVNGEAKLNVTGLDVGRYIVNVTYLGDSNYDIAQNHTYFNITKANLIALVIAQNVTSYMNSTFIIIVPDDYAGQVTITVDGKTYSGDVASIIQMTKLTVGNKTAHVEFTDDKNYKGTELDVTFNVNDAGGYSPVTTVINSTTVVVNVPENVNGNVTVVLPNGTNKTVIVENGSAIVTLENMTPGTNNITVIYTDGNNTITTNATITVPKHETKMNVTVNEATAGGNTTVTVEVPVDATGNITVTVDGKTYTTDNITNGKAIITIENLTAGDKTLIVEYSGNANYTANYTLENFTVAPGKVDSNIIVVDHGNGTVVVVVGDNATGNVTIKVGDKEFNATVVDGTAIVNITNVTPGIHEVEVIYSGDDIHSNATATANITAPKYDAGMNVTVGEVKEGEAIVIAVEVPVDATGNVTIYVGGKEYNTTIEKGKAIVSVNNVSAGNHTIAVEYAGDSNYSANYTIVNMTVDKAKSESDLTVVDYGNGTVVVVVGDNATGNVTIKVGDKEFNATVIDGKAIVNLENITPGIHDVEVIYSGDDNHNNATLNTTVNISKGVSPMDVEVNNINVGDNARVKVTLAKDANGYVTIEIDGKTYTKEIIDGVAIFEIENLIAGQKSVFATYVGGDNYASSYSSKQFNVSKVDSSLVAEIVDVKVGEKLNITVHVPNDATGQVLIDIDGIGYYVNVSGGVGNIQIPRLGNGTYDVTLTYVGDDKYLLSSNLTEFKVEKISSFVIPTANNIIVGENEEMKFIVPADATGNVTVIINNEEYNLNLNNGLLGAVYKEGEKYSVAISGGNGELVISGLPKGEYLVSVRYNGDYKYLPSENTTMFTVSMHNTPMDVIDQGNGTIKVILPSNATGIVTITDGDNVYTGEVINGTAIIYLENTTPGKHDLIVKYGGDGDYSPNTTNIAVEFPKYDTPISVETSNIYVGETETVVVTLPKDVTGTVTIEIDSKEYTTSEIIDGKAIFKVVGLAFGNKTVAVKYSGDKNYRDNYTTGQFVVSKLQSDISAVGKDITVGSDEIIVAFVPSDASGQVLVDINGVGYYGEIINGKANVIIPDLPSGKYSANVIFDGDDKYLPSTNQIGFTVSKFKTPLLAMGDVIPQGEEATVVVKVPNDATGTVTITIDNKKYTAEVKDGKAVFKVPGLIKGSYDVNASYSGDKKYEANDTITDVEVYFNETPAHPENGNHNIMNGGESVSLANYATGNPIMVLLLVLFTIGLTQIRKFKK